MAGTPETFNFDTSTLNNTDPNLADWDLGNSFLQWDVILDDDFGTNFDSYLNPDAMDWETAYAFEESLLVVTGDSGYASDAQATGSSLLKPPNHIGFDPPRLLHSRDALSSGHGRQPHRDNSSPIPIESDSDVSAKKRPKTKVRTQIPESARSLLDKWFQIDPYPDAGDIEEIGHRTSIPTVVIQTWFRNNRSRRPPAGSGQASSKMQTQVDERTRRLIPHDGTPFSALGIEHTEANPIQPPSQWRNSHPSGQVEFLEAAPLTEKNIAAIAASGNSNTFTPLARFVDSPLEEDPTALSILAMRREYTENVWTDPYEGRDFGSRSRADSIASGRRSNGSMDSNTSRASRRGRRRHTKLFAGNYFLPFQIDECAYYCTFCGKKFHGRWEWARHEISVHVPQDLWICPFGQHGEPILECPCCDISDPSPAHLASHNTGNCQNELLDSRTYSRLEHLVQHMKQAHCEPSKWSKEWRKRIDETWKRSAERLDLNSPALLCGFCGHRSITWRERAWHVGNHLRLGVDLSEWWLGRIEPPRDSCEPMVPSTKVSEYGRNFCDSFSRCKSDPTVPHYWSCSFFSGVRDAFLPLLIDDVPVDIITCRYCSMEFDDGEDWTSRLVHLSSRHRYRNCQQDLYTSEEAFEKHLASFHAYEPPPCDWEMRSYPKLDRCKVTGCLTKTR